MENCHTSSGCRQYDRRTFGNFNKIDKYDLYCFSLYWSYKDLWLLAALTIKRRFPDAKILFGGPDIILHPNLVKIYEDLNIMYSFGDIESSIIKAIECNDFNCTSYIELKNLTYEHTPKYEKRELDYCSYMITLNTSRGCSNKCYFCNTPSLSPFRVVKREVVLEWFKYFNKVGVNIIEPNDPTFNCVGFDFLLDGLIKIDNKCQIYDLHASFYNMKSANTVKKMSKVGIKKVCFGMECCSPMLQKNINKKFPDYKSVFEYLKILEDTGVQVLLFYIYGLPTQTVENFKSELEFIKKINDTFKNVIFEVYSYYCSPLSYIDSNREEFGIIEYNNYKDLLSPIYSRYDDMYKNMNMLRYKYDGNNSYFRKLIGENLNGVRLI